MGVRSDEFGGDGVRYDIKARGVVEVRGRKRLDVVVSKGVWNCGEEWSGSIRIPSTE